jgi:hypothetical protein
MAMRTDVYAAVDGERYYQDQKWGKEEEPSIGDYLTFIRVHLREAERLLSAHALDSSHYTLHEIRKITALGVACMERHGIETR